MDESEMGMLHLLKCWHRHFPINQKGECQETVFLRGALVALHFAGTSPDSGKLHNPTHVLPNSLTYSSFINSISNVEQISLYIAF